jgi:prophage regulatory protein
MTHNINQPRPSILRLRTVLERTGLSRSTIYALMRTGEFPRQIALGPRSVGWLESDVEAWISARVALTRH